MPYQKYTVPSTVGISFASGPGTLQALPAGYTCTEEHAKLVQSYLERDIPGKYGTLVNAALDPSAGVRFSGLDPASPYQPWWVTGGELGGRGPVGPAVVLMFVNGVFTNASDADGDWVGLADSNPRWVVKAKPTPVPPPPPAPNPNDANVFASLMGANNDQAKILAYAADSHRLIVAMAKERGIS